MIIKMKNRTELQVVISELKKKGYTQVNNAIKPIRAADNNYIQIKMDFGLWAFCSQEMAETFGYIEFE